MGDNRHSLFDEIDWQISQELRKNARISASEIARVLNLKPRTVRNRIDRMMEFGAARPFWVFEPNKFGYVISVDIFLEIDTTKAEEIYEKLIKLPQVSYLAYGNDKEHLSIEGLFKNLEDMDEFIYSILPSYEGIKVQSFALVPKVLRNLYEWQPEKSDFRPIES